MTKMNLSHEPTPDTCPGQISWHYERAEIIADGVVHAIGVCLGLIGAVMITALAVKMDPSDVAAIDYRWASRWNDSPTLRASWFAGSSR